MTYRNGYWLGCSKSNFWPFFPWCESYDDICDEDKENLCRKENCECDKDKDSSKEEKENMQEPANNDGRTTCFWCNSPTKSVPGGFVNNYDICTKCGR